MGAGVLGAPGVVVDVAVGVASNPGVKNVVFSASTPASAFIGTLVYSQDLASLA